MNANAKPFWNPYLAGAGLGLTLLLSYVVLGTGLGASGAIARIAAVSMHAASPEAVEANPVMGPWFEDGNPLRHYLVAMLVGSLFGGFLSSLAAGRAGIVVERGPRATASSRLIAALFGGALVGIGARLSLGCTSGLALSGGALLQAGSFVFVGATFAAAFAVAPFLRRLWR
jgi:uncharacterized membrane protein YedE/YeeE